MLGLHALLLAAAAASAATQITDILRPDLSDSIGVITTRCSETMFPYSMTFNQCFLVPLLLRAAVSGPQFVQGTNTFLENLCLESTPPCADESLRNAIRDMSVGCLDDVRETPAGMPSVMLTIMENYPLMKEGFCSRSSQGQFCAIEIMTRIQDATGMNITYPMLRDAVKGNSTYLPLLAAVLESGALCTGCVSSYLYMGSIMNTTAILPDARPSVRKKCGAAFGTQKYPEGVFNPLEATRVPIPSAQPTVSVVSGSKRAAGVYVLGVLVPLALSMLL